MTADRGEPPRLWFHSLCDVTNCWLNYPVNGNRGRRSLQQFLSHFISAAGSPSTRRRRRRKLSISCASPGLSRVCEGGSTENEVTQKQGSSWSFDGCKASAIFSSNSGKQKWNIFSHKQNQTHIFSVCLSVEFGERISSLKNCWFNLVNWNTPKYKRKKSFIPCSCMWQITVPRLQGFHTDGCHERPPKATLLDLIKLKVFSQKSTRMTLRTNWRTKGVF